MSAYSKPCGLELNCLWFFLPWFNYEKVRVAFKRKITNIPPSVVCGLQLWAAWQPRTNSFLLEAKQFPFSLTPLWLAGFSQLKKSGKCDLMLRNSILAWSHGFCYLNCPPSFVVRQESQQYRESFSWLLDYYAYHHPLVNRRETRVFVTHSL